MLSGLTITGVPVVIINHIIHIAVGLHKNTPLYPEYLLFYAGGGEKMQEI